MGKTRAAVEYAWAHADAYRALLFAAADSPDALERNLAALCAPAVIDLPEQAAKETPVQIAAVLHWLGRHPDWLLILDNVDTPAARRAVAALLPSLTAGHLLITSRLADCPAAVAALDLDVLSLASSVEFLLARTAGRRTPRDDDPATAARLAGQLDRLALALEQAAAYIRHRRCALADYLAAWEAQGAAVLDWHDPAHSHYPRSIAITYETSVAQLSPEARDLFRMLAWLAPEPFPRSALFHLKTPPDPDARLVELTDLHLAELAADGRSATIHRLVQEITRRQQPEAQPPALLAALAWVNQEMPDVVSDVRAWPIALPLLPHAKLLATVAADRGIPEPTTRLLNQIATVLLAQANHRAAEPLMRRALAIDETSFGPDHPKVATDLNNLAQLLQATNRLPEAEPLMRRALEIFAKFTSDTGHQHPHLKAAAGNYHAILVAQGATEAEAAEAVRTLLAAYGVTL